MTRVKTGPTKRARHNKVLKRTSGFRMTKNRLYKVAHEAYMHALQYAFEGRRKKKGDFRSLWITRINASLRAIDPAYSYSRFVNDCTKAHITLNRKSLSELAIASPSAFKAVVDTARRA
jgi:large subunit ribosomal protein L20